MNSGYDFVPLPDRVNRCARPNNRHDQRLKDFLQVKLEVEFHTDEPVHIGAGSRWLQDKKVVREGARVEGRPGIPGSSLRGVLRSRFEAISRSCCVSGTPKNHSKLENHIPSSSFPRFQVDFSTQALQNDVFSGACRAAALCLCCSLFGRLGQRSRLSVQDFTPLQPTEFLIQPMPQLFSPRPHHLGHFDVDSKEQKLIVRALHGRKFHQNGGPVAGRPEAVEAIPAKVVLGGVLSVVNASKEELGALLVAMGAQPPSFVKIGSGKAHRFGRMTLCGMRVQIRDGLASREASADEQKAWGSAFASSNDRWEEGERKLLALHGPAGGGS